VLGVPGTGKTVIKQSLQRLPENQHCPLPRSGRILKRILPNCHPISGPLITPGIR
jgi:hypothetical protein